MPEKMKLKCSSCGTWFKASGYKRTLCPSCFAKAERARTVAKSQPLPAKAAPATRAPAAASPGRSAAATQPTATAQRPADSLPRPASAAAAITGPAIAAPSFSRRLPVAAVTPPPRAPKPKRDPMVPTLEQVAAIERRYTELAQPAEFDGIRAKIADELGVPKAVVKRVVKEYRERLHLPSWWDVSHQPLTTAQIELVRERYAPLLPLPPIGVHHQLASELGLNGWAVYQAIGQIRQQLGLARYNEREDAPRRTEPASEGAQTQASKTPTSVVA